MKKALLIVTVIFCANLVLAQDQLFMTDNTKLLVKITEIRPESIKYKQFDNLNGPSYVLSKNEVSLIIYENGNHEVIISNVPTNKETGGSNGKDQTTSTYKIDSLSYYKYAQSISINFLNFANNEFAFIYQREFYKKSFNLVIPFAIGLGEPIITESVYFGGNSNNYYYTGYNYSYLNLNRKLIEFGLGLNYYASLKHSINYYIGPMLKFIQYSANQTYYYANGYYTSNPYYIEQTTTLNRFTASITNGMMFRTKGRLAVNLFASLGFEYDELTDKIVDPVTQNEINPITKPVRFYFWAGTCVGYSF
jgi:hypothetical protein